METVAVQGTIRLVNATPHTVMVSLLVESEGQTSSNHTFGPILPHERGETTVPFWKPGTVSIRAT